VAQTLTADGEVGEFLHGSLHPYGPFSGIVDLRIRNGYILLASADLLLGFIFVTAR